MSGQSERVEDHVRQSRLVHRFLAANPGPMTLEGTNSYLIREHEQGPAVLVDPGPALEAHVGALSAIRGIELILITHHHADHTAASAALAAATGAPVRARRADFCIGGTPLNNGEVVTIGGVELRVLATPGHTADSVSFVLPDDGPMADGPLEEGRGNGEPLEGGRSSGSVLTGDTILGRGSTVLAEPDGSLADFLDSMRVLEALGDGVRAFPGHGPALDSVAEAARGYTEHRRQRLEQVRDTLRDLGLPPDTDGGTVARVTDRVYGELGAALASAARSSVRSQLVYLANLAGNDRS